MKKRSIGEIPEPHKFLKDIPGLEDFVDYAISINGNVYSFKHFRVRKLKPMMCYSKSGRLYYEKVRLSDKNKKQRNFYNFWLLKQAFKRTADKMKRIEHLRGTPKVIKGKKPCYDEIRREIEISDEAIEKIKIIQKAAIIKGIKVSNDLNHFFDDMIDGSINDFKVKYGLNKILYQMENGLI